MLCQEFLRGKEYVIDQVSRDGIHKTMMVWVYDKRPANNSAFVYFGMVPVDPSSMEARILIPYARGVLDALGVKNGPSHAEVSFPFCLQDLLIICNSSLKISIGILLLFVVTRSFLPHQDLAL